MRDIGYRLTCDRCGKSIFLDYLEGKESKGIFDLEGSYEKMPAGWKHEFINGHMYDLCNECHEKLETILKSYMEDTT